MKKKFDIVALGSCTMDLIFAVEDIMRMNFIDRNKIEKKYVAIEHSTKLNVKEVKSHPGGSGANIACDLANMGYNTAYIGGIGKDPYGDVCLTDLKKHKVDVSGVKIIEEDSTAISIILITPWGKDRSVLAYKGANNLYTEEFISIDMLQSTRCFAWTSLTSTKSINAIKKCIEIARSSGSLIAGAPSISIIKNCKEDAINLLKNSDITSMNDEELEALTEIKDIHKSIQILFDWGLKIVNVTFGKDGQWLSDGKSLIKTKPPKVFPQDTTGAGDASMSGIIFGYLEKKSLQETARIAASLSAMEIETMGVRVGIPEAYVELEKFMNEHEIKQDIVNF